MNNQGYENKGSTAGKDEMDMVGRKEGFEGYVACVDDHPLRADPDQTDYTPESATNTDKFQKKMPFWRRCCVKFCRCCCCCCPKCNCCCCVDGTDD